MNSPTKQTDTRVTSIRTIVAASAIGTTIEWYDFLIYATAASLVLNKLFFPTEDPLVGKLIAISTVGVGFFARPFGAVVFSHFGDRLGRKSPLILTMVSMGLATTLIGLLPTYASIGIAAPILLVACRLVQGIAVGGEWGGAVLIATEHSPPDKRGFYGSLVQIGFPLGMSLGTASFFALAYLDDKQFMSWGWRIPFLASAALVAIGIFVRLRIDETPDFKGVVREGKISRVPGTRGHAASLERPPHRARRAHHRDIMDLRLDHLWIKLCRHDSCTPAQPGSWSHSTWSSRRTDYDPPVRTSLRSCWAAADIPSRMRRRDLPFIPHLLGARHARSIYGDPGLRGRHVSRTRNYVRCTS